MLDAAEVERRTGWRTVAHAVVASTNDEAAVLRDAGVGPRVVVVADRQLAGRGRGGRRFASPEGGLYASLLVSVRVADLPAPVTAAVVTALAEAVEARVPVAVAIKWPNDLWIGRRKVAGILTEASFGGGGAVVRAAIVVGVGVNLAGVPGDLEPEVAAATTALDLHAPAPVRREDLLAEFLPRLERRLAELERPATRAALEAAYRARLALRGERVRFFVGDATAEGTLVDASLDEGLLVRDAAGTDRWWAAGLVREVRAVEEPPMIRR